MELLICLISRDLDRLLFFMISGTSAISAAA